MSVRRNEIVGRPPAVRLIYFGMPTRTVLVVDDHPDTCAMTIKLIQRLGYPADCVTSGYEALEFLRVHPVGLILLDLMMPVMDGMETLSRLAGDPDFKSIPVVMYSALSDQLMRDRAMTAGAKDFLVKGNISLQRLEGVLKSYMYQSA